MNIRKKVCVLAYEYDDHGLMTDKGIEIYFDADIADVSILRLSCQDEWTRASDKWSGFGDHGESIAFELADIGKVEDWIDIYPDCEIIKDCTYDMTGRDYIRCVS